MDVDWDRKPEESAEMFVAKELARFKDETVREVLFLIDCYRMADDTGKKNLIDAAKLSAGASHIAPLVANDKF